MVAFRYDGTFEGLLSAVFDAYILKDFPDMLLAPNEIPPLAVTRVHTVARGRDKADRVFKGLGKRVSGGGRNVVLLAFLSEEEGIGSLLFRYMRKLFDRPPGAEGDFSDPDILAVDRIARQVACERHLLFGFARFQKTADGIYTALLGPKYNVLSLVVPHFRKRFAEHPWILYDVNRCFGFFHKKGRIHDIHIDPALVKGGVLSETLVSPEEKALEMLWREYFTTAAIAARANPVLQARCLPRRFWPYMTELRPPR